MKFIKDQIEENGKKIEIFFPLEPYGYISVAFMDGEESKVAVLTSSVVTEYYEPVPEYKLIKGQLTVVKAVNKLVKRPVDYVIKNQEVVEKLYNWVTADLL